jgi:hypothetical protein
MRLFLHVGMSKTGSTSIQSTLARNRDELAQNGFLYPVSEGRASNNILALFFSQRTLPRGVIEQGFDSAKKAEIEGRRQFELFATAVRQSTAHTCILSGEYFFNPMDDQATARFERYLTPLFDDVTVIAYVRDPASYFLSILQQRLKGSYLIAPIRPPDYSAVDLYSEIYETQVIPFETEKMINGDSTQDFLNRIGIDFLMPAPPQNRSLSAEGMQLMKEHRQEHYPNLNNKKMRDSQPFLKAIRRAEALGSYTKPELNEALASWLRRPSARLANLKSKFGIDFMNDSGGHSEVDVSGLESRNDLREIISINESKRSELLRRIEEFCQN